MMTDAAFSLPFLYVRIIDSLRISVRFQILFDFAQFSMRVMKQYIYLFPHFSCLISLRCPLYATLLLAILKGRTSFEKLVTTFPFFATAG